MAKDKIIKPFVALVSNENKFTIPTIDDLVGRQYLAIGDVVDLQGYYEAGDGAHHKRKIEATDDGSGVQLAGGLWANIVHNGEVNIAWFGAKDNFSSALSRAISVSKKINISDKYKIDSEVSINSPIILNFNNSIININTRYFLNINSSDVNILNLNAIDDIDSTIIYSLGNTEVSNILIDNIKIESKTSNVDKILFTSIPEREKISNVIISNVNANDISSKPSIPDETVTSGRLIAIDFGARTDFDNFTIRNIMSTGYKGTVICQGSGFGYKFVFENIKSFDSKNIPFKSYHVRDFILNDLECVGHMKYIYMWCGNLLTEGFISQISNVKAKNGDGDGILFEQMTEVSAKNIHSAYNNGNGIIIGVDSRSSYIECTSIKNGGFGIGIIQDAGGLNVGTRIYDVKISNSIVKNNNKEALFISGRVCEVLVNNSKFTYNNISNTNISKAEIRYDKTYSWHNDPTLIPSPQLNNLRIYDTIIGIERYPDTFVVGKSEIGLHLDTEVSIHLDLKNSKINTMCINTYEVFNRADGSLHAFIGNEFGNSGISKIIQTTGGSNKSYYNGNYTRDRVTIPTTLNTLEEPQKYEVI